MKPPRDLESNDRILYWLTLVDDYVMLAGLGVAFIAALFLLGTLAEMLISGSPL